MAGFNELGLQWSESPCGIALLARRSVLAREICLVWLSSAISAVCQGYRVALMVISISLGKLQVAYVSTLAEG